MADDEIQGPAPTTTLGRLRATAEAVTEPIVDGVSSAIDAAMHALPAVTEPIVEGVTSAIDAAKQAMLTLPGHRVRAVRRRGRSPLASLPELHPQARRARPVEVGFVTIDVDAIGGTAVGGGDQRGGDFLPLRPFRGSNWRARWQRLQRAHDRLADLPPIDVVRYADRYWVIDGHNRVALALYAGQVGIDANVVELVPPGGRRSEPIVSMAAEVEDSRLVRGRVDAASASEADLPVNEPI